MGFRIEGYSGTDKEDREIIALLNNVFVQEGYTEKEVADRIFTSPGLQKRGNIKLARSPAGRLLGMAIFVLPSSPECQVANTDECEIHLLVVYPEARGQGVASHLIGACENEALKLGYFKIVLSTQQSMEAAHHVYQKNGYIQNSKRNWTRGGKIYLVYEKTLKTTLQE